MTTIKLELEVNVRIEWDVDEDPDLSFLGTYSNTIQTGGIDREERGDKSRNEYRFFNPGCGDPAYIEDDYRRMEAYNAQQWCMLCATVTVTYGKLEAFASMSGVDSDSDDHRLEVERELTAEAMSELEGKIKARLEVE